MAFLKAYIAFKSKWRVVDLLHLHYRVRANLIFVEMFTSINGGLP